MQRSDGRLQVQRRCSLGLGESVHELGAPVCEEPHEPCDACGDDPSEWPCVVCHQGHQGHELYRPDPDADAEADRVMLGDGLDLPGRCHCGEVMLRVPCTHVVSVRGGGWRQVGSGWATVCLSCAGAL